MLWYGIEWVSILILLEYQGFHHLTKFERLSVFCSKVKIFGYACTYIRTHVFGPSALKSRTIRKSVSFQGNKTDNIMQMLKKGGKAYNWPCNGFRSVVIH